MTNYIIKKKDYLDIIKNKNNLDINIQYVHPLLNLLTYEYFKRDEYYILPQYIDSIIKITKEKDIKENDNIKINIDSLTESSIQETKAETEINPLLYFTCPVNSNNFLEIVFSISNLSQLNEFINLINSSEILLLDFVLSLYWKNNYDKIDQQIENFIIVNKKIFLKFFNKNLTNDVILKIINRLIKNNYGKKIKYISKIKKYLTKYI